MIKTSRVSFPGSAGTALDARYDHPVGPVRATALFAHCFTCSKDLAAASRVARALARRGIVAGRNIRSDDTAATPQPPGVAGACTTDTAG